MAEQSLTAEELRALCDAPQEELIEINGWKMRFVNNGGPFPIIYDDTGRSRCFTWPDDATYLSANREAAGAAYSAALVLLLETDPDRADVIGGGD